MSTPVVFNGVNYSVPAFGDVGYAQGPGNLSAYLIAIASGTFQTVGGLFSLTAQADFGPNFGLTAVNFTSRTANPAAAGIIRLANVDTINWRNFANSGDLLLGVNVSDQLTFNGLPLSTPALNGTVNTGVAGRLTLYPAAGNTVDDVYVQNSQNIDVLIATQAARTVALEYTIPNPGNAVAAATFALLELAQTFTAAQTFSQTITISAVTNQIVLGTGNTITLTAPAPAASRTYTIPDVGGAASLVMTAGTQSIAGVKTFTGGAGAITMSASTIAMGANKITGLANGTVSTDAAAFGQIFYGFQSPLQATSTTEFTTTSSTFQTTNLTQAITPTSSSHRIKVTIAGMLRSAAIQTANAVFSIFRDSTNLGDATNGFGQVSGATGMSANYRGHVSCTFIDSPATAGSVTYSVKIKNTDNVTTAGFGAVGTQVMVLEEIV